MATEIVTLDAARSHLRITSLDHDADIQAKLDAVTGIIVEYLKSRANRPSTIVSSSVAAASVITTSEAHGYATGESVVIADHEDSTPDLNGTHTITVLTSTTFSVPVTVTVAGTGGTGTVIWTAETAPEPVKAAALFMLEDLFERRPIDWEVQRRLLERSRDPALA